MADQPEGAALNAAMSAIRATSASAPQLLQSLQARLAALPPPARHKVMASLATIEKAKEDLEQRAGQGPEQRAAAGAARQHLPG